MTFNLEAAGFVPLHANQRTIHQTAARFRVVACGRRFGKTELGKWAIAERALHGQRCWWLAPTYGMAAQVWRDLRAGLADAIESVSVSEYRLDLIGGGLIAVRSTHTADYLRGAGLDFAVLDEAAFMLPHVWPQVVRPMLLERRGDALFLSTPRGRNHFWDVYRVGLDPEEHDWASFHFTSYDNPLLDRAEIDAIKRITPERVFREEYLAMFLDDTGGVFRGVREAATAPPDAMPIRGRRYVAGVDWGRSDDYTAVAVLDADAGVMVALDRFRLVDWALQRGRIAALHDRWTLAAIWAETNSIGSVNIEALQADGLPMRGFTTTAQSKAPLIDALALAIERRQIALLPDAVLLDELMAYRAERLRGGGYRYSAPPGGHDDTVMALAMAWHGARFSAAGTIDFA